MFWGSRNRLRPPDVFPWRSAHHSITRLISGCLRFFTLIQCFDRPASDKDGPAASSVTIQIARRTGYDPHLAVR
jgi:hypothetical protein